jgi:hypothetical protein
MTYVDKEQSEFAMIQLTHMSSFRKAALDQASMFITLVAKYHTPAKFDQCVARHNAFLNGHRNIAIVGIHPDAMDATTENGNTLWTEIRTRPGVFRCDPCRRTPDLGKWNIPCTLTHHPAICEWLDANLVPKWNALPNKSNLPPIKTFPIPERLSKGRTASSGSSVNSGLIDASPVEDYFRTLEANPPLANTLTTVFHNAWDKALPVEDIVYCFNAHEFPKMADSPTTNMATTAHATSSITGYYGGSVGSESIVPTSVSAITESIATESIESGISAYQLSRKIEDNAFAARMVSLEQKVGSIQVQVTAMATKSQTAIIQSLTGENGIISAQNAKFVQLATVVDHLADSIEKVLEHDRDREGPNLSHNTPPRNR